MLVTQVKPDIALQLSDLEFLFVNLKGEWKRRKTIIWKRRGEEKKKNVWRKKVEHFSRWKIPDKAYTVDKAIGKSD